MAELLVHACNGITGARVDTIPVSAFSYERLLSAGGAGSAAIPLDGSFGKTAIKTLVSPWRHFFAFERDGVLEYNGYVIGSPYTRGSSSVGVTLGDLWSLLANRLAVDHSVAPVAQWQATVTGNLMTHVNQALIWARDSYTGSPDASFPLTIGGVPGGPSVSRTYYGYHLQTVVDMLTDLMDEGLDVYFQPRWGGPGLAGWTTRVGPAWSSGVTREFSVTAKESPVTGFSERVDGARMLNNSIRVGEGSEVDMLTISNLDTGSTLPLLERSIPAKTVTSASQLSVLAGQDLVTYGAATSQWDFTVSADTPIDVGDLVRLQFDGDPWIDDGFHVRRVVKVSGDMSEQKTIGVQPTGGA